MSALVEILIVLALVLVNGFLSMSELAIVSVRRARLEQLAAEGRKNAATALHLAEDPTAFLATVQVGITLVGIISGAYSGATLGGRLSAWLAGLGLPAELAHPLGVGSVVVAITYLSLIGGELVPKRLALQHAEAIAQGVARPMTLLASVARPLAWLLRHSVEGVVRALRLPAEAGPKVSGEEVRALLAEGRQAGIFAAVQAEMIERVLHIADRPVRAVMTPRPEIVWLDLNKPAADQQARMAASSHSRFPVGRGSLHELAGIVQVKDLAQGLLEGRGLDLARVLRPPVTIPDNAPVTRLLDLFRSTGMHMVMVVDEYGVVLGLATPADLLAAIAGELPEGRPDDVAEAVQRDDGSWLMDGRLDIHQAERLLQHRGMAEGDRFATLAGFVLHHLRRMPRAGESLTWKDLRVEVVDLDGRRIDKLLVQVVDRGSTGG